MILTSLAVSQQVDLYKLCKTVNQIHLVKKVPSLFSVLSMTPPHFHKLIASWYRFLYRKAGQDLFGHNLGYEL